MEDRRDRLVLRGAGCPRGAISGRREVLAGLLSLPLAMVSDAMISDARGQETGLPASQVLIEGEDPLEGVFLLPEAERAPAVVLIHEWWGLNDRIKALAEDYRQLGFLVLAIDLFAVAPATSAQRAAALAAALDADSARSRLTMAINWLAAHERSNGRVGTVGWGFGGGWSLDASLATAVEATVVYYGNVDRTVEQLRSLKGAVLCHFATRDPMIDRAMVDRFEAAMQAAGKGDYLSLYWYEADHAFGIEGSPHYDASNARLAGDRTIEFLRAHLGGA